jgi:hypothetical protein
MIEKTKVLAAMIALDEFTTDQLCRFADVKPATAAGVLGRNKALVQELGTVETGRRGGQPIRYRLTDEGRAAAQEQLERAFASFGKGASNPLATIFAHFARKPVANVTPALTLNVSDVSAVDPPLGIAVADDTLSRLLPAASSAEERLELLAVAEREAKSALQDLHDSRDVLSIREMVGERLERITAARTAIREAGDVAALRDATSPKVLKRMFGGLLRLVAARRQRTPRPLRLQIWSVATEAADLRTKIAQTLEQRAEVFVTDVPSDPEQAAQIGDAVILLVDSRETSAVQHFQQALAACKSLLRPLLVLDQDYSPGFRNLVLGSGAADYRNDAGDLDQAGIANVIEQAAQPSSLLIPVKAPKIPVAPGAAVAKPAAPAAAVASEAAAITAVRAG